MLNYNLKVKIQSNFFSKKKLNQTFLLLLFDKTLYNRLQTKMSSAINASIQALVLEEKSTQIDALKEFLTKKVDDSDEICAFIDEFTGSTSERKLKSNLASLPKNQILKI